MNDNKNVTADFAPHDPTDGRKAGDWETRYCPKATAWIRFEAWYLAIWLVVVPIAVSWMNAGVTVQQPKGHLAEPANALTISSNFPPSAGAVPGLSHFWHAWLGGTLGGAIFSIKWFYHSVAKNTWNIDRRFWRVFTPHVSGALGAVFVMLSASGLLVIFDKSAFSSTWICFGLGFLVGYFSDNAVAKLTEVAQTLFGTSQPSSGHEAKKPASGSGGQGGAVNHTRQDGQTIPPVPPLNEQTVKTDQDPGNNAAYPPAQS